MCDEAFWQNTGQEHTVCNGCESKCHRIPLSSRESRIGGTYGKCNIIPVKSEE